MLSYGAPALVKSVTKDLKEDLLAVYDPSDVYTMMSLNSIGNLLQRIGMDGSKRKRFYQLRMKAVATNHHVAIDGTLKQDNSKVNDLSRGTMSA